MFRQIIVNFGVRIVAAVLSFLIIVLLSRELGPDGKGICTRYLVIIANSLIFCDLIGGPPLVYLSSRFKITRMLFPSYAWSALTSCAVIYTFIALKQVEQKEFLQLAGLSFLNSCIAIHQNILSGRMQFGKLNIIIFTQSVFAYVGLKILFMLNAPTTENYLYSLYLAWGVSALLGLVFIFSVKDNAPGISFGGFFTGALKYGFVNAAGHVIQFFNQRLSYFFLLEKPLGIFSNAVSLGESVWMISTSIATVQYGKVSNTDDKSKAEKISLSLLRINLFLCFLAALLLALLPDRFFTWIFGPEFSGIHPVLLYLFPGLVFYSGYLILGHHFSGRGEFFKNLIAISGGLFITIIGLTYIYLNYPVFTMTHAAIITGISYFGNFLVAILIFYRDARLKFSDFFPSGADIKFIKEELKRKKD